MKHLALVATVALGWATLTAPANAALFSWDIEYTNWWEDDGGGSIFGTIIADENDVADGIVSADELKDWQWNWSGNEVVSAFSISSKAGGTTDFDPSFYVNDTPNQPIGLDFLDPDNLDQGSFVSASGNEILDLQALLAISFMDGVESVSAGNPTATLGTVSVSEPTAVPEPASILGLLALAGVSTATLKRQKQDA
ncbi:MAG: PEP-CTERM sorting domain-containing protein [Symplocastrum torsivum CPER-KK1]|uniref:PEP-CTERM sorting domain-containing protein n=1 Tax=Symplocastrum torsivum CPER-KK1 TaxID=450513 RepID=A0A951PL16_9CYAN|nr:PEP-CTERM sorting domain-containing protein [Symplocastrum torsivum CPER-KK1]